MVTSESDYQTLLSRARDRLPERVKQESRWEPPQVQTQLEGTTTIITNWPEILDRLNRPADHLLPFLLRELGTAGNEDDDRVILQGKRREDDLQDKLKDYIDTYVVCSECSRPDTHLEKVDRTLILRCDACGAHYPVKARKVTTRAKEQRRGVSAGDEATVQIVDMGRKGDGVAKRGDFTIFVPGTRKGDEVTIIIEKVSGNIAFARLKEPEQE